jgi:hypothetical protein
MRYSVALCTELALPNGGQFCMSYNYCLWLNVTRDTLILWYTYL